MEKTGLTQDLSEKAYITDYYLNNSVGLFKAVEKNLTEPHFKGKSIVLSLLIINFLNTLTFQWKVNYQSPFYYQNSLFYYQNSLCFQMLTFVKC